MAVARRLMKNAPFAEIEEAQAAAVEIIYELHTKWDGRGTFYGYCTKFVQYRLISWWRREMRQRNLAHKIKAADGKESFVYHGRVSLDEGELDFDETMGPVPSEKGGRAPDRQLITVDANRVGD